MKSEVIAITSFVTDAWTDGHTRTPSISMPPPPPPPDLAVVVDNNGPIAQRHIILW